MSSPEETVTAPSRSAILESLLALSTVSISISVWFAFAARDIKRITGQSLTPFLWFFVPLFALVQPVAFPLFFSKLRVAEQKVNLSGWTRAQEYAWMFLTFGVGMYFIAVEFIATTLAINLFVFVIYILLYFPLYRRLNSLRSKFKHHSAMYRASGYNVPEWIIVTVLLPVMVIVYGYFIWQSLDRVLAEKVPTGAVVHDIDNRFSLTLTQSDWVITDIGTQSDGSAIFELDGPLDDMWYSVFYYDSGDHEFNDIAQSRLEEFTGALIEPSCESHTSFYQQTLFLRADIVCESKQGLDAEVYLATVIEGENSLIEVTGYLAITTIELDDYKKAFVNDAQGLVNHDQ
ncbi:hypothetical protein [Aestuariibacter sp. A3R04]|uniref:hypothetical protein n=1 Tax=Aestuariibacter sp. A3R04 TaxID=2841571 RepID=UPI001C08B2F2|nr:hypothetical protein [Aestuariibacter sp. A3R04]MBU3023296.1 hypothetical protein [Aestuariibacter sp. A3R04]